MPDPRRAPRGRQASVASAAASHVSAGRCGEARLRQHRRLIVGCVEARGDGVHIQRIDKHRGPAGGLLRGGPGAGDNGRALSHGLDDRKAEPLPFARIREDRRGCVQRSEVIAGHEPEEPHVAGDVPDGVAPPVRTDHDQRKRVSRAAGGIGEAAQILARFERPDVEDEALRQLVVPAAAIAS